MVKHPNCPNCGNKRESKKLKKSKELFPLYVCRLCDVIYNKNGKILSRNAARLLADDFVKSVLGIKLNEQDLKELQAIKDEFKSSDKVHSS